MLNLQLIPFMHLRLQRWMQMQHRDHRSRYRKMKLDIVFVLDKHQKPSSLQGCIFHKMQFDDDRQPVATIHGKGQYPKSLASAVYFSLGGPDYIPSNTDTNRNIRIAPDRYPPLAMSSRSRRGKARPLPP